MPLRNITGELRRWLGEKFRPRTLGEKGEAAAIRFLKRKGYVIVARQDRGMLGEIDIVAVDGKTVVFVEVKTRRSHDVGRPEEAVGPDKQRRLSRLAMGYLKRHCLLEQPARFDVIAVTWPLDAKRPQIEHFENAFQAVGTGQMFS
jgi:putative endonuclease